MTGTSQLLRCAMRLSPPKMTTAEHGDEGSRQRTIDAEGGVQRERDGVGLHGIEAETEGHGNEHGKERGGPAAAEAVADIVGGASAEAEGLRIAYLVDLGKRAFGEAGSGADDGDDPHPEYGARTADHDGDGYAGNVAYADAGSRADAEGLEGADVGMSSVMTDAFLQQSYHFPYHAQLNEAGSQGKPEAERDEHDDENIGPQNIIGDGDEFFKKRHALSSL